MSHTTTSIAARVAALREALASRDLAAYLVPTSDAHQNEYVPDCWQRRAWISGFTGSAGLAVVTASAAGLWTDSRYYLQAEHELDAAVYTLFRSQEPDVPAPEDWLCSQLAEGARVGYDPLVLSVEAVERMAPKLAGRGLALVAVEGNLIDALRPEPIVLPSELAFALPPEIAGEDVATKLGRVRERMAKSGAEALVVTTLDAIAWLFNVRGTDIPYNPVVLSYGLVTTNDAGWFVDERKVSSDVRSLLEPTVSIRPYEALGSALEALGAARKRTWIDAGSASAWVLEKLAGAPIIRGLSPIAKLKAVKTAAELDGMRRAHVRDGVAMVRFLRWLGEAVAAGGVTEASAGARLDAFRAENERFRGLSFETISAYGPHAAIPHYRVTPESNLALEPRGLYLVDSGGQYLDGTTDITRTVALGPVEDVMRDRFTRVLRGHIELSRLSFPRGSGGHQLELAARLPLWDAGLDYGHGTGHGVGFFLNVHEGPFSISPRATDVPLEPGMISSNEPGYYEAGAYGIRIENLVHVVRDEARSSATSGREFYTFENLTVCPIDRTLVDTAQMSEAQLAWLDGYHARVRETLAPLLTDPADGAWLEQATRPIG
ncbi:MAG: aminopeptidase P family protein [Deltaproteobacteria bacterium]|nr:aminopeptidase P family protein [Deltaproteobacteria bacterium]